MKGQGGMELSRPGLGFIHRFEPANPGCLTLLLLHGTGGNEEDLIPLGRTVAPGAALLSPRGKVLENGMPRFFRRFAEGVFDIEDLKFRSKELADFVRNASVEYGFDLNSVVAVGYSNGANIAVSMLLLGSLLPVGALLFRPMVPVAPDELPNLGGISIFISAGRSDPIVPRGEPERLAKLLGDAGAVVTLSWETATHALTEQEVEKAASWLLEKLRG
jgi:predicted esterase